MFASRLSFSLDAADLDALHAWPLTIAYPWRRSCAMRCAYSSTTRRSTAPRSPRACLSTIHPRPPRKAPQVRTTSRTTSPASTPHRSSPKCPSHPQPIPRTRSPHA